MLGRQHLKDTLKSEHKNRTSLPRLTFSWSTEEVSCKTEVHGSVKAVICIKENVMNQEVIKKFLEDHEIQSLLKESYFDVSFHDLDSSCNSEKKYVLESTNMNLNDSHFLTLVLLRAALAGNVYVVKSCLEGGANISFTDAGGRNALHHAVVSQSLPAVERLISWKREHSDPLSTMSNFLNERDLRGWTPLHIAVCRDMPQITEILLHNGADMHLVLHHNCSPCRNTPNHSKLIHFSAIRSHIDTFDVLIRHGADSNEKDALGLVPLHYAASRGNEAFTKHLLSYSPEAVHALDNYLRTPLHVAAMKGMTTLVKLFLKHGATPTVKDIWDLTPCHLATVTSNADTAEVLLAATSTSNHNSNPTSCSDLIKSSVMLTLAEIEVFNTLVKTLRERETELLRRCVARCGSDVCLSVLKETLDIQRKGGICISGGNRKKTSGGIFLKLLRERIEQTTGSLDDWVYITALNRERQRAQRWRRQ